MEDVYFNFKVLQEELEILVNKGFLPSNFDAEDVRAIAYRIFSDFIDKCER